MKSLGNVVDRRARAIVTTPVFEWLPHHLQGLAIEFRKFIQEQYPVVHFADFTRRRWASAADQSVVRDGVVWAAMSTSHRYDNLDQSTQIF